MEQTPLRSRKLWILLLGIDSILLIVAGLYFWIRSYQQVAFDGERAYADVAYQMALGPRLPGGEAHAQTIDWIEETLRAEGWTVELQVDTRLGHPIQNVIAKRGSGRPWIILGAHYDSRLLADQDPDSANHTLPVPGANDGASGVAILLELGRVLSPNFDGEIWLAFFDAEDNGNIEGWDWILGSRSLAESLTADPDAVIIVDMIGDADLNIYREANSDGKLTDQIWAQAAQLGFDGQFIDRVKYYMLDDHTPFLARGIPAVDIIDFDYPYWHTTSDTLDKISAESLQAVGSTILAWLITQ